MLVRILAAVLLAAVPILATVSPAAACSCAYREASEILELADGAFVGRIVSTESIENSPHRVASVRATQNHTFEVESVIRGEFEQTTQVLAPYGGAICGLSGAVTNGARIGVITRITESGLHGTHLCSMADADDLIAAVNGATYPALPMSNKIASNINDLEVAADGQPVPAINPDGTSHQDDSGRFIPFPMALVAIAVLGVGYALWRIVTTSKRGQQ